MSAQPAPPPPYPADTRAKGWRFEIDYEQIEQSTTWGRAKPEARPWLLMLWMTSWKQVPCGSLPDDLEAIAGTIGIPDELWERHSPALMRGWWRADDGRLYHDTLVKRVIEMMAKRRSDSDRQQAKRAREALDAARLARESGVNHDDVTRDAHMTPGGVGSESATDNRPPNTEEQKKGRAPRKRVEPPPAPEGVAAQVWGDWLELRRKKGAPVTQTVIEEAQAEACKAGLSFEAFLRVWCVRGSQGLMADWLKPNERGSATVVPLNRQEALEQRNREVGDRWLREQEEMHASQ